jgi:hypothetical protein
MRGNLRALGLALLAAFAMSAVIASATQATPNTQFTTSEYNSVIYGAQEGTPPDGTNFLETTPGRKTECHVAEYEATLTAATSALTVTPHYAGCVASGVSTNVDLNGCHYKFAPGTAVDTTTVTGGKVDIICPAGKDIKVTIGPGICEIHVPAQTGLTNTTAGVSGVTYTNEGVGAASFVTIDVNVNNLTYTETDTPSSFLCPFTAHTTHASTGVFRSEVKVSAFKDSGNDLTAAGQTTPGTTIYTRGDPIAGHVK